MEKTNIKKLILIIRDITKTLKMSKEETSCYIVEHGLDSGPCYHRYLAALASVFCMELGRGQNSF